MGCVHAKPAEPSVGLVSSEFTPLFALGVASDLLIGPYKCSEGIFITLVLDLCREANPLMDPWHQTGLDKELH